MSPRAPSPSKAVTEGVNEDALQLEHESTKTNEHDARNRSGDGGDNKTVPMAPPPSFLHQCLPWLLPMYTFHWELNVYTFGFLGLLYHFLIPSQYYTLCRVIGALILLDATKYYYYRGNMAGVPYTLPFVSLAAMIIHPTRFWADMAGIAMEYSVDGICTNTLVGNFMIFSTNPDLNRHVMTAEGTWGVYAHPNALWLFGPKNLIYMDTDAHKAFRAILAPALFSHEALTSYALHQERVVRTYLEKYCQECATTGQPVQLLTAFRAMAAASSQEAFVGPYLTDELRAQLTVDIQTFTMGFLHAPIPWIGGLRTAIQAKDRIEHVIAKMIPQAREYVKVPGNEPRCLIERWSLSMIEAAKEKGIPDHDPTKLDYCDDENIARTVLDFLFAAQDATNSALNYTLDVLDEERAILNRVRAEIQSEIGPSTVITPTSSVIWTKIRDCATAIPFTQKVANQMLHHKPPVPMIPHLSKKTATLLNKYTVAAGTVFIPSLFYAARVSGGSTELLPERPDADSQFVKLQAFGAGQHKCPGRKYAETLVTVFLGVLASGDYDFHRPAARPSADEYIYFPTLFPRDTRFYIYRRGAPPVSQ
jgi:cytochrome P450